MIVRLYTPKPAHVDLLPKIIEVRRGYTLGIARRIKRRHVGILHQKPGRCRHSLQQVAAGQEPILPDFHEHDTEGYALFPPETRPLADLANCFMPYVVIKAYGPPAS
jgi:hypothetical protein